MLTLRLSYKSIEVSKSVLPGWLLSSHETKCSPQCLYAFRFTCLPRGEDQREASLSSISFSNFVITQTLVMPRKNSCFFLWKWSAKPRNISKFTQIIIYTHLLLDSAPVCVHPQKFKQDESPFRRNKWPRGPRNLSYCRRKHDEHAWLPREKSRTEPQTIFAGQKDERTERRRKRCGPWLAEIVPVSPALVHISRRHHILKSLRCHVEHICSIQTDRSLGSTDLEGLTEFLRKSKKSHSIISTGAFSFFSFLEWREIRGTTTLFA